jgi:threonine/homoserine/homoserine lactone efflux protein
MSTKSLFLQNVILGISLAAPIGPVAIEIIRRGLRFGFSSAFAVATGAAIGDAAYLLLTYFGLYGFLMNPIVKGCTLFFGALALIYLGLQCFKEVTASLDTETLSYKKKRKLVVLGFFLAVANPISIVWWVGVFGASMASEETLLPLMSYSPIILGVIIWNIIIATILEVGSRYINNKVLRIISAAAGLSLIGFGIYFGYQAINFFLA